MRKVSGQTAFLLLGIISLLILARQLSADRWIRILDDANLVFHEAGHPLFGLFGPTLGLYGGTIGQLVFPVICSVYFWRLGEASSFILCFVWLCENLLNISRYMADARTQILPLVGGGEHDWTAIFSNWHVLPHDQAIAGLVGFIGWIGILACVFWMLYEGT